MSNTADGHFEGCSALKYGICEHGFIARPGCNRSPMKNVIYGQVACVNEKLAFIDHPETGSPSPGHVAIAKKRIAEAALKNREAAQ